MSTKLIATLVLGLSATTGAHASLMARGGGMVYDDVNNITWTADANLFQTQAAINPNLVNEIMAGNGGVAYHTVKFEDFDNRYRTKTEVYYLSSADFNTSTGGMTWFGAQAWANNLTLGGYTDWSLPGTPVASFGTGITSSPMGDLFYNQLGGVVGESIVTTHNNVANYDLFTNVQSFNYWSSTQFAPDPGDAWSFTTYVWYFSTRSGFQEIYQEGFPFYAWAVRPGDVATVPVPSAIWIFASGLGFLSFTRRKKLTY